LDFDFVGVDAGAPAVVAGIFAQVFAKIGPSAANSHHYSLSVLADESNEELDGRFARTP
jgi:hypothetical protein